VRLLLLLRYLLNELDQHKRISRAVASDLPEPSTIIPFDRHVYIQVAKRQRRSCQQCAFNRIQDRRAGRLVEPSNTIRRTQWKCAICLVSLCKNKKEELSDCWKQYHSNPPRNRSGTTSSGDVQLRKARRKVPYSNIQNEMENEKGNEEGNEKEAEKESEIGFEMDIEKDNNKDNKDNEEEDIREGATLEHELEHEV
jgi:hypothetical protein